MTNLVNLCNVGLGITVNTMLRLRALCGTGSIPVNSKVAFKDMTNRFGHNTVSLLTHRAFVTVEAILGTGDLYMSIYPIMSDKRQRF